MRASWVSGLLVLSCARPSPAPNPPPVAEAIVRPVAAPVAPPSETSRCDRVRVATESRLREARRAASAFSPSPKAPIEEQQRAHALLVATRRTILADPANSPEAQVLYRAVLWSALHSPPEPDAYVPLPDELHLVGTCVSDAAGAWAIELESLAYRPPSDPAPGWQGRWVLARYQGDARVAFAPATTGGPPLATNCCEGYGFRVAHEPVFFDADRDGVPEVFLRGKEEGDEGHLFTWAHLLTFTGGELRPYPAAADLDVAEASDVDHDGAIDLITHGGYRASAHACGSDFDFPTKPPSFVAHAVSGGRFSVDDAVAKASARAWCPSAPKTVATPMDALCSRMWTRPEDRSRVRSAIDRGCQRKPCSPSNTDMRDDCSDRLAWFDRTPPLVLP